jgi:hypothetical protein
VSWIKEAEQSGINQARGLAEQKLHYTEEDVTPQTLTEFLTDYLNPVQPIIQDLKDGGYSVDRTGPDFIHHSYERHPGADEDLSKFSLTRRVESTGWGMTGYSKMENQVYGVQWVITKKKSEKPDDYDVLGTIDLYPTVNETTHFAGVQYRTETDWDYHKDREILELNTANRNAELITESLRLAVSKIIGTYAAKSSSVPTTS